MKSFKGVSAIVHNACRIDTHSFPQDCGVRRETGSLFQNVFE